MIQTKRLELIRIEEKYAGQILDFYKRNKDFLEPFEPLKDDTFYQLSYHQSALKAELIKESHGRSVKFLIFLKESYNPVIGMITLNEIVRGCFLSCFIGYKMDEAYTNRGFMTEAVKAVVDYGFNIMKLHRIEANIMPWNKASLQVVTKLGFENEGLSKRYLKINGKWEDHIHMVKLNDDYSL